MKLAPNSANSAIWILLVSSGNPKGNRGIPDRIFYSVVTKEFARLAARRSPDQVKRAQARFGRGCFQQGRIDLLEILKLTGGHQFNKELIEARAFFEKKFGFVVVPEIESMGQVSRSNENRPTREFFNRFSDCLTP